MLEWRLSNHGTGCEAIAPLRVLKLTVKEEEAEKVAEEKRLWKQCRNHPDHVTLRKPFLSVNSSFLLYEWKGSILHLKAIMRVK